MKKTILLYLILISSFGAMAQSVTYSKTCNDDNKTIIVKTVAAADSSVTTVQTKPLTDQEFEGAISGEAEELDKIINALKIRLQHAIEQKKNLLLLKE